MTNRKRDKAIYFFVSEAERDEIYEKMKLLGTSNLSAYMRKMAIDGYVIEVDHSDIREAGEKIKKIGQHVNEIARRVNTVGYASANDMQEVKKALAEILEIQHSLR